MGMLLPGVSAAVSVLAYALWKRRFAASAAREGQAEDLAAMPAQEWPGLVGLLLPRGPRRSWNLLVLWTCTLLLGGVPHGLVLHAILTGKFLGQQPALLYLPTLAWWAATLSLPALALARHQAATEATRKAPGGQGRAMTELTGRR